MKTAITYRTLSDGSRVWAVTVTDDDSQSATFECLSEKEASRAFIAISEALQRATGRNPR